MAKVGIVLATQYPDKDTPRFSLAVEAIKSFQAAGYSVFIGDSSPSDDIRKAWEELSCLTCWTHKDLGITTQRQQAANNALGHECEILLFCEPEKNLGDQVYRIVEPIQKGEAALVIPTRSEETWRSYPTAMQVHEGAGLDLIEYHMKKRYDILFGPWAVNEAVYRQYFSESREKFYAWPQVVGLNFAKHSPDQVAQPEITWRYPPAQHREEEGNPAFMFKRLDQLHAIIQSLGKVCYPEYQKN